MSDLPTIGNRHWIEYVATGLALAVSVISLWVAIETEDANNKMVAASSWPFLQIESSNGDDEGRSRITLAIVNAGVGPAKIETFEVFWKGKAYRTAGELLKACCARPGIAPKVWSTQTGTMGDIVVRAGETRRFLTFARTDDNQVMWKLFDQVRYDQLSYRACYCSVFDECWLSDLKSLRPVSMKVCPVPRAAYRE